MANVQLSTLGSTLKSILDAVADTNFMTDAERTKLAGLTPGGSAADNLFPRIFLAADTTGATDVTAALVAFINASAGRTVYVPPGTYKLSAATAWGITGDMRLVFSPDAVVIYDYAVDNRAIWVRNESDASLAADIIDITNVTYFHGEVVSRIQLASVSGWTKDAYCHIHAQNGWLSGGADDRRIGQSGRVAFVDSVNNYLYLYQRLELEALLTTSPRIRKYTNRRVSIEGGVFRANGDNTDATLQIQNNRRAAIEVYGTPEVEIRNVKFERLWAQAIMLRSCPFFIVENCDFNGLVNLMNGGSSSGTTASISVTGVTNANPGVFTLADASTISNGNFVLIHSMPGMPYLNRRVMQVTGKSGNTVQLIDYFADGDVSSPISTVSLGTYSGSGSISRADVNSLGYGLHVYAASCYGVMRNCRGRGCRHLVTSDAIQDSTYTDAEWATYGLPTNVTIKDVISLYSEGIPFDEHEEAVNWIFENCVARCSSRGPSFQDSYYGVGFQTRGINSTFINCIADGGAWGLRVSMSDAPLPSTITIKNCLFKNLLSKPSEGSYGIRVLQEVSDPPYFVKLNIDGLMISGANTGIQTESGSDVKITATNIRFYDVDELLDLAAGTEFVACDRVVADFRNTQFAAAHYCVRMRSSVAQGGSKCLFLGGLTLIGDTGHHPVEVFYQSDTTVNKHYYMPTGGLVQFHGGATAATLLSASNSTLIDEDTANSSITIT